MQEYKIHRVTPGENERSSTTCIYDILEANRNKLFLFHDLPIDQQCDNVNATLDTIWQIGRLFKNFSEARLTVDPFLLINLGFVTPRAAQSITTRAKFEEEVDPNIVLVKNSEDKLIIDQNYVEIIHRFTDPLGRHVLYYDRIEKRMVLEQREGRKTFHVEAGNTKAHTFVRGVSHIPEAPPEPTAFFRIASTPTAINLTLASLALGLNIKNPQYFLQNRGQRK